MTPLKQLFTVLTFSAFAFPAFAQDPNATLFSYSNGKVTVEEFERYFLKNINFSNQAMTADKVREDLDLYIKFKLKIKDAQDAGMDTLKSYLQEVEMFRDQLANLRGRVRVSTNATRTGNRRIHGAGRNKSLPSNIVNDLSVHMSVAAEH